MSLSAQEITAQILALPKQKQQKVIDFVIHLQDNIPKKSLESSNESALDWSQLQENEEYFTCSVYDLLNRHGFMEGHSLIPEEKPLVKKACDYLANSLGIIDQRWQPVISIKSQHYVTFRDMKEDCIVSFYDLSEVDRRKIQFIMNKKNLNRIQVSSDLECHAIKGY